MTGIVEHQRALLNLLVHHPLYVGKAVARAAGLPLIGIPHNLAHLQLGVVALDHDGHVLGILQVVVSVAIIT